MNTAKQPIFSCLNVHVDIDRNKIVKGVDLEIFPGEVHAFMGPNGSGKSTFASAIMGHPDSRVSGRLFIDSQPIDSLAPHERARKGIFLGFQYPVAIPGLTVSSFLKAAYAEVSDRKVSVFQFHQLLKTEFEALDVPWEFASRYLNDGFSGGEKKRLEILQMRLLKPKFAILDEIDSGLDVDALKTVSKGIVAATKEGTAVLLVTHYQRLLDLVKPDVVHYFMDGKIIHQGTAASVLELEANGYEWLKQNASVLDNPPVQEGRPVL